MKILQLTEAIISERISEFIEIDQVICTDETWKYDNFVMNLCGKWDNSYVLILNNEIAGYVICSIKDDKSLHIHRLAIKKKYQNMGLGTSLINNIINNADKNIKVVTLMVHKDNIRARGFYKRNNFKSRCLVGDRNMYVREL